MTVKAILRNKGYAVHTIEPGATLAEAARLLDTKGIGALVVSDAQRRVIGILSERDIVRKLAEQGARALDISVEGAMTRRVATCQETDSVGDLMEQMTNGKFRHVPVVEEGRLIGIISIGDVVKYRLGEMEAESIAMREYIQTA
ncbi:MAG TPA: CBS domain-containing protein [Xanthobacteraceae bacterium]|nr:CBS domain-containing protein [Xanthobacteraceae bacterium]